jgi:hypothetical protein
MLSVLVVPPPFDVEFPTNPKTYAYTTTPAAMAMSINNNVAIIGLIPRFLKNFVFSIDFQPS